MERALQWWYEQQSRQLTWEAMQIRDSLLQESFAVRRSLELSQIKPDNLSIERFEIFHAYLKELSDRLSPPYLEEGLPLAIEYLVQKWQTAKPNCELQFQSTLQWQQSVSKRNRIILTAVDELLKLEIADFMKKAFIVLDLQQTEKDNQLKITIEPLASDLVMSSTKFRDLEYLSQFFRVLTSGTWQTQTKQATTTYYLRWLSESDYISK